MENVDTNMTGQTQQLSVVAQPKKKKHRIEIQLYEADYTDVPDGHPPKWRPVNMGKDSGKTIVVEVTSKEDLIDLQQRYVMCDQRMKIVRIIDPFDDQQQANEAKQNQLPMATTNASENGVVNNSQCPQVSTSKPNEQQHNSLHQANAQMSKPKPKVVMIGDVEVKYDGDKVYQKQWIKLTQNEANNFRIVNSSTNKIISMAGKHIEAKRWTLVEDVQSDDNDVVESIIMG